MDLCPQSNNGMQTAGASRTVDAGGAWRSHNPGWLTVRSECESDRIPRRRFPLLLLVARGASDARPCARLQRRGEVWLEPRIELAQSYGMSARQINAVLRLIQEHEDEIRKAWKTHFGS